MATLQLDNVNFVGTAAEQIISGLPEWSQPGTTSSEGRSALGIAGDAANAMVAPYYIDSVSGNDLNSGRTASAALKTFSALIAKGIVDGDRIYLKRGSYFREALTLTNKNNLIISAYGAGAF